MQVSSIRVACRYLKSGRRDAEWPKWSVQLTPSSVRLVTNIDRWESVGGTSISKAMQGGASKGFDPIVKATRDAAERLIKTRITPVLAKHNRKLTGSIHHSWDSGKITPVQGVSVYQVRVEVSYVFDGPSLFEIEKEIQNAIP